MRQCEPPDFLDSSRPEDSRPETILADRYRVIGLLGRGGMGEVYRARRLKLGQPVALSSFRLSSLMIRCAGSALCRSAHYRQLSHPNICRVYDIGEIDGGTFFRWNTSTAKTLPL